MENVFIFSRHFKKCDGVQLSQGVDPKILSFQEVFHFPLSISPRKYVLPGELFCYFQPGLSLIGYVAQALAVGNEVTTATSVYVRDGNSLGSLCFISANKVLIPSA